MSTVDEDVTLQCHYAPQNDLCSRCYRLELHTAAALSAWLWRTYGINSPVAGPLPADVLVENSFLGSRRRLKTHLFTAAFGGFK